MTDLPYQHIAVCMDDSPAARQALAEAIRLRAFSPGRLTVLHSVEHIPLPALVNEGAAWYPDAVEYEDRARGWLADIARGAGAEWVLLHGYAAEAVTAWAARNGVDLLVAAAHRGVVDRVLLGSFAVYLARHAPCAILLIRPAKEVT
jgi:nucleotide-binding universal stress UspA family protein